MKSMSNVIHYSKPNPIFMTAANYVLYTGQFGHAIDEDKSEYSSLTRMTIQHVY